MIWSIQTHGAKPIPKPDKLKAHDLRTKIKQDKHRWWALGELSRREGAVTPISEIAKAFAEGDGRKRVTKADREGVADP